MTIDQDRLIEALQEDELVGFCVECGEESSPVEPDARRYECESCGKPAVYGAQEVLLMGI